MSWACKQMKKTYALQLSAKAKEVAGLFSNPKRIANVAKEKFEVESIEPLSESSAVVIYIKNTGKKAIAFFYTVKDEWRYFFIKESHVYGMIKLPKYLQEVESYNYPLNFKTNI